MKSSRRKGDADIRVIKDEESSNKRPARGGLDLGVVEEPIQHKNSLAEKSEKEMRESREKKPEERNIKTADGPKSKIL